MKGLFKYSKEQKHYPKEWTDMYGSRKLSCVCGNIDPFHIEHPLKTHIMQF